MIGLYIHIPFCRSKCVYCDFASWAGREEMIDAYIDAVLQEAERVSARLCCMEADTVFIGGGTPSVLSGAAFTRLWKGLCRFFDFSGLKEFTLEANPGTLDEERVQAYASSGVNRLSMGLQAAQPVLLKTLGRIHTPENFLASIAMAHRAGITNINGDMMTGLPGQTVRDAAETAEFLTASGVKHISCYGLMLEEGTPLYRMVQNHQVILPDDDAERDCFASAEQVLYTRGFQRYEISNFAMPGFESKHNLKYWQREDYVGLGCAAASFYQGKRTVNVRGLEDYISHMQRGESVCEEEKIITSEDAEFETIMLSLRLTQGLNLQVFSELYQKDFCVCYAKAIEKNIKAGLMKKTDSHVYLTPFGLDLQNTVLMDFMS